MRILIPIVALLPKSKFQKSKMADGSRLENRFSAMSQRCTVRFNAKYEEWSRVACGHSLHDRHSKLRKFEMAGLPWPRPSLWHKNLTTSQRWHFIFYGGWNSPCHSRLRAVDIYSGSSQRHPTTTGALVAVSDLQSRDCRFESRSGPFRTKVYSAFQGW